MLRLAGYTALLALLSTALAACGETSPQGSSQFALAATVAAEASSAALTPSPPATAPVAPTAVATATSAAPTAVATATSAASTAVATATSAAPTAVATATSAASTAVATATSAASTAVATVLATIVLPSVAPPPTTIGAVGTPDATISAARATTAATEVAAAAPPTAAAPTAVDPGCDEPCTISFAELYSGASVTGPQLSPKALALNGRQVTMHGYMAPPLSTGTTFFVLTKTPMVYCPFCNSASDWPFDIVYVKMADGRSIPTLVPTQGIELRGRFEVGDWTDPETGFVSLVRVFADSVEVVQ